MIEWPEVFTDENFRYGRDDEDLACAQGLMGWANCMCGNKPPEEFGKGMIKIYNVLKPEFDTLGIAGATPENLAKVADLMKKNREGKK